MVPLTGPHQIEVRGHAFSSITSLKANKNTCTLIKYVWTHSQLLPNLSCKTNNTSKETLPLSHQAPPWLPLHPLNHVSHAEPIKAFVVVSDPSLALFSTSFSLRSWRDLLSAKAVRVVSFENASPGAKESGIQQPRHLPACRYFQPSGLGLGNLHGVLIYAVDE